MSLVHQPHDKFATTSLKQIAVAKDFFKAYLPPAIYQRLDLTSLQTIDKTYISPELQSLQGDIVYRCQIEGHMGYIPILFLIEHQSTADRHMALRLWQYTLKVMQDHLQAGHDTLPIVLPLCLYHGTESPYPYSRDIYDNFADPALARQYVFQPFELIDLTQIPLQDLEQHGMAAVMEILLQSYRQNIIRLLQRLTETGLLTQTVQQTGSHYLESMLNYLAECGDELNPSATGQLIEILNTALPDQEKIIMTFKEQFKAEGRAEGHAEGHLDGLLAAARGMLLHGMSIQSVSEIMPMLDGDRLKQLQENLHEA
jgi:predicted transposase/invertase (TIGR01784 family)